LERIEVLLERRSIRRFKKKRVPQGLVRKVLGSAQRAPTSCGLQAYSFVQVSDQGVRERIASAIGMQRAMEAPVWVVVCVDFHRPYRFFDRLGLDIRFGPVSRLVTGLVDASLAAENIAIAAEAVGLGSVFIGSVWAGLVELAEALKLPRDCMPALLVCMGYPAGRPGLRPRWPLGAVHHRNAYREVGDGEIDEYYRDANQELGRVKYFRKGIVDLTEHYAAKFRKEEVGKWDASLGEALRRLNFL